MKKDRLDALALLPRDGECDAYFMVNEEFPK
jgi:hypothetical protein